MQRRSSATAHAQDTQPDCVFCHFDSISTYILKEATNFRVVADHAPLVEGHLLIIPKQHYACYGAVPAELDEELFALKHEVHRFFLRYYDLPVYWEHGVFRQTVFHAHLHCFPFGETGYVPDTKQHWQHVHSQDDIRAWYNNYGPYFYMEDHAHALLFAANMDDYTHIIRDVLVPRAATRNRSAATFRSPQQRQVEGKPLIASLHAKWQEFQQESKQAYSL